MNYNNTGDFPGRFLTLKEKRSWRHLHEHKERAKQVNKAHNRYTAWVDITVRWPMAINDKLKHKMESTIFHEWKLSEALSKDPNKYRITDTVYYTYYKKACSSHQYFVCNNDECILKNNCLQIGRYCNCCKRRSDFTNMNSDKPEDIRLYPIFDRNMNVGLVHPIKYTHDNAITEIASLRSDNFAQLKKSWSVNQSQK